MSNINTEIYGTPETWDFSFINGGLTTDAAKALKIQKAKVPRWAYDPDDAGYWNSQLRQGIVDGAITQNMPIDKTVCTVGMGRDCPYSTMGYFRRRADTEHPSDVMLNSIASVGNGGVVNGFLWEMRDDGSYGVYNLSSAGGGQIDEKQMEFRCWAPESNSIRNTNKQNGNYFIAPYTYYQLKTFIASVEVNVCNSADVPDDPTISGVVPQATWRPLDTWKNSYPTHKITGFRLNFARANAILDSGGRITYTRPSPPSAYTYSVPCGFGLLDEIQFDDEYDYKRYMYALFNDSASGGSWNTVIFKPFIDTTWNSSVHRVGFMGMFDKFNGDLKYLPSAVWYQIDYSEEVYEQLCRAAATFGFIFVTNGALTLPSAMNTDNICFPVINSEGIAHGDYTRGADNLTNDIYNADSTRDKNYNPVTNDPNTYSNTSYFKMVTVGSVGCKRYALSVAAVNSLMGDLWSLLTTFTQDTYDLLTQKIQAGMLVSNPIESIVSLMCFPFVIPNTGQDEPIKLGKYDMTARGTPVSSSTYEINFQGVPIYPRFGNCYLDYEPYTNYEVYVPFCGTIPLKAADILGHTLNIKLIVDLFTGSCTGYIMADSLVIETITGTVAITIPVTGLDSSTINSQIVNANLNYKSSLYVAGSTIGSMVSVGGFISALSNPAETVNKIAQSQIAEEKAQYDLTHIPTQPHMVGASSPALGWCCDTIARVMIYYPTGDVITDSKPPSLIDDKIKSFGDLNGFSCLKWGKVREFSGFTLGNIKLDGVPCTESERARLKQLFSTGVYL